MKKLFLSLILCLPVSGFSVDRLAALSMLESGDNDRAIGRAGEVSRYQILRREWRSVTNSAAYTDSETARQVAVKIMEKRIERFQAVYNRPPNDFEYYGLWNAPAQILEGRVSPVVAERCKRFVNLCEREQQLAQASGRRVF